MAAIELNSLSSAAVKTAGNAANSATVTPSLVELVRGPTGHGRAQLIKRLLENGAKADVRSEKERTLLHILAMRTHQTQSTEELQEDNNVLEWLVGKGADVNHLDSSGLTALHVAARGNGSEKMVRNLIDKKTVNLVDNTGKTALDHLLSRWNFLSQATLEKFAKAGAILTEREGRDPSYSPLVIICGRHTDGHNLLLSLLDELELKEIQKYTELMFKAAVLSGSAATVELLLAKFGGSGDGLRFLMLDAASSKHEAYQKLNILIQNGLDPKCCNSNGSTLFHAAAASSCPSVECLKLASQLEIDVNKANVQGNTPLHLATTSPYDQSCDCVQYLLDVKANPNAVNADGCTPMAGALGTRSYDKVMSLVKNGCIPVVNDFTNIQSPDDIQDFFLDTNMVAKASDPIGLLVQVASYCWHLSKTETRDDLREKWKHLWERLEDESLLLIEAAGNGTVKPKFLQVLGAQSIFTVVNIRWYKFLNHPNVMKCLNEIWYGQWNSQEQPQPIRHYAFLLMLFLLQSIALPFLLIIHLPYHGCNYKRWLNHLLVPLSKVPVITFMATSIGYVIFVVLLIARVATNGYESSMTPLEWVIFVYVLSLIAKEVRQFKQQYRNGVYLTRLTNWADILMLLLFSTYYILRWIGFSDDVELKGVLQRSDHMFGFAVILACLRLLAFFHVHPVLGPIQVSFVAIMKQVAFFLVILGVFLLSFGLGITNIYNGGHYSNEGSLPPATSGLWPSLKTLFWALFGLIDLDDFLTNELENDETTIGKIVLALWLLLSVIVLLNMLIALVTKAFENTQENSETVWKKAYVRVIEDITRSPSFPVPINLFHITAEAIYFLFGNRLNCRDNESADEQSQQDSLEKKRYRSLMVDQYLTAKAKTSENTDSIDSLRQLLSDMQEQIEHRLNIMQQRLDTVTGLLVRNEP